MHIFSLFLYNSSSSARVCVVNSGLEWIMLNILIQNNQIIFSTSLCHYQIEILSRNLLRVIIMMNNMLLYSYLNSLHNFVYLFQCELLQPYDIFATCCYEIVEVWILRNRYAMIFIDRKLTRNAFKDFWFYLKILID